MVLVKHSVSLKENTICQNTRLLKIIILDQQGYRNTWRQLVPKICGFLVWKLLHDIFPATIIVRWILELCKICTPLYNAFVCFKIERV